MVLLLRLIHQSVRRAEILKLTHLINQQCELTLPLDRFPKVAYHMYVC